MTKKASTPALRFKGFTYTWEQRKLGEILQEHNTRTSDFESNPLYSLTIESGITPKTDRYERSSLVTKTEDLFKVVKPNEFVTNPMNLRFGALGYNKNAFDISVSGYYDVFSIDDDKCSGFWNSYFKTPTAMNIFDNAATGSLIEKRRVKYSTLQQLVFYMPRDLSEKAEIGKYMDTLDHLITLHQRKYDKLTNMKKSMLEKMFPKNGANVPEIRFKGFTDAWEQRKLGEAVQEVTRNDATSDAPIMMITANNGFIEQSERYAFNNAGESLKKYILLEKGELAYNHGASKLRPYGSCFTLTTSENARIPFVYHCFSADEQNSEFLSIELNGADVENQLRRIVSSGARMDGLLNISFQEYVSVSVLLPTIEEQNKIADFFKNLDNLITLHQRELEKLKNFKKACLEKMFV